ncbi:MAG TPA: glycosyltransferase family 4 protein [Gemmataceae bacterium]|nr:glycosyltransferase family 4 protein [Gemmataceae bacterium]
MPNHPTLTVASSGLGHVARGIEAWASDLAMALAARGVPVTLCKGGGRADRPFERVLPCWQREAGKSRIVSRLLPKRVSWRVGLGSPYEVEQLTFTRHLLRHLRRQRVDILHVQDPWIALLTQRAGRLGLVPTRTILAHGTEEPLKFQRKIRYLQHLAPWHRDEARAAGIDRPTWTAIPNFIDTDVFAPGVAPDLRGELGIPADGFVVLSVAAIKRAHKRVDYLVTEFAQLLRDRLGLPAWLVVAGGWEAETDALVAESKQRLGDRVRFLVRFPRDRMPDLYRAADVFALASLKEMMPIAVLEATATGLPALVHRHPVLEWIIGPGGEAIDMSVAGALAGALGRYVTDRPNLRWTGMLGRDHCLRQFARDAVLDRILDYYQFVLADGRPTTHGTVMDSPILRHAGC